MRIIIIFYLLILIIFLLFNKNEYFLVPKVDPRKLKVMKLEKDNTFKSDNRITKIKKMTNYLIQKLHDDISNSGPFLRTLVDINANKKSNGCINYSNISANVMGGMLQNFNPEEIKKSIDASLNSFQSDYDYLVNNYYNLSKAQLYQDKKEYGKINDVESYDIMTHFMYKPKYVINLYKNNFQSDKMEIYTSDAIKQSVLYELNKIDLDKFPKFIINLVQKMDQIQCKKDKKCCV